MSLRSFTVFQDETSGNEAQPSISRPKAPITRSSSLVIATANNATSLGDVALVDKENYHPVTGERAGLSSADEQKKKRKTDVLATKFERISKSKLTQAEPETKKRRAPALAKVKAKKPSGSTKKITGKRTGSKKVSPMPSLNEVEEVAKEHLTQADIDSRCYELTVKPLADISKAYDEVATFNDLTSGTSEEGLKFCAVKASSVEPEIRDYFQPSQAIFASSTSRLRARAQSEEIPESRAFSTPERKQIYAAFTFSSPSSSSTRNNASGSGSISPAEQLSRPLL